MINKGWIKLHRQILEWEWLDEPMMVALFVHLLLMANSDEGWRYRGVELKAGQLITSLSRLSEATGITIKALRTRLARLVSTGEISVESCKNYSIITIPNYAIYQPMANETANKGQTENIDNTEVTSNANPNGASKRANSGQIKGQSKVEEMGKQRANVNSCKTDNLQGFNSVSGQTKGIPMGKEKGNIQEYNIYISNNNISNNNIDNNIEEIEEKKIIKKESEQIFEEFRKAYKGKKRGFATEFENFKKKYPKSWKGILPLLMPALEREEEHRKGAKAAGEFVPQWAMLQTWINQSRWEMEYPEEKNQQVTQVQPTSPAANEYGGDFGGVDY